MSIKASLKKIVTAKGGTSTANTIPGVLGEISTLLGGESDGKTIAKQLDNIAAALTSGNSEVAGE
jgi:hypothetical protein